MQKADEMTELLNAHFWDKMQQVYTIIPAYVLQVYNNLEEMRIAVQPSINILNEDGTFSERSAIANVPVIMPASSTSAVTFPISVGDTVLCLFSMRAMEVFSESADGKPANPNNFAKFRQKDAIAIAGLFPRRKSINNPSKRTLDHDTRDMVVAHNIGTANECEVRLKADGSIIINSPTKVVVNTPETEINSETSVTVNTASATINADSSLEINSPTSTFNGNIQLNGSMNSTGNIESDSDVLASGISLNSHTHQGSPTAPNGPVSPTGGPN